MLNLIDAYRIDYINGKFVIFELDTPIDEADELKAAQKKVKAMLQGR